MDVVDLLSELVAIDSTNRTIAPDGAGERAMAAALDGLLVGLGFTVVQHEVTPGRPNVVGVRAGTPGAPTILLEAHLDTVPTPPGLVLTRTADRLGGRGSCDCKGALAAMLVAIDQVTSGSSTGPIPTIVVAGSVDEEAGMTGAAALLGQLPPVDVAIIAEPTSLVPVRAHNGIVRCRVRAGGRAAHTSLAHLGVNAVAAAATLVARVERDVVPKLVASPDPLTGPALLTAAQIRGGTAPNVVPSNCEIVFDRRTPPGLSPDHAFDQLDAVIADLVFEGHDITRDDPFVSLAGLDLPATHPAATWLAAAAADVTGTPAELGGVAFATDACQLSGVGSIPCLVLGPGSIDQAHTADEWVDLHQVHAAVDIYATALRTTSALGPVISNHPRNS